MSARLRALRLQAGLSQVELASAAGVSRQLVGAVEAGRHLPRVDAALALARALDVSPETLFGPVAKPLDVLAGVPPEEGATVRAGLVGDQVVTAPPRPGGEGWGPVDGVVESGRVVAIGNTRPGVVMAGCEPGLETLESMLSRGGVGAMTVVASSGSALTAMNGGRAHAAVVHAPEGDVPSASEGVVRFGMAGWNVGLALPAGITRQWWDLVMAGEMPVVQREPSAAAQVSFTDAAGPEVPGPLAVGHLSSARHGLLVGIPALTIEPVAIALGARFHPLEPHRSELWIERHWVADRGVQAMLGVVTGRQFRRQLESIGGYHLEGLGSQLG